MIISMAIIATVCVKKLSKSKMTKKYYRNRKMSFLSKKAYRKEENLLKLYQTDFLGI